MKLRCPHCQRFYARRLDGVIRQHGECPVVHEAELPRRDDNDDEPATQAKSKNRCMLGGHDDVQLRRGSKRVKCRKCGDAFPCTSNICSHLDCIVATNRPLPDYVHEDARDAILAELAILYPTLYPTANETNKDEHNHAQLGKSKLRRQHVAP